MTRTALARKFTVEQLVARARKLENDPKSHQPDGIHLYTPKVRRKLDDIAWAIRYLTEARRKADLEAKRAAFADAQASLFGGAS